MMTLQQQYQRHALRILNDGLHHADEAITWAISTLAPMPIELVLRGELNARPDFTLRELSLGATGNLQG